MSELVILSQNEYEELRSTLKDSGLDLCYTAKLGHPLRRRWPFGRLQPEWMRESAVVDEIDQRRPSDPTFRIASVEVVKPGNRLFPATLSVTYHAANAVDDPALKRYLSAHFARVDERETAHASHDTVDHATTGTYVRVALLLAFVTLIEVAAFYLPDSVRPPRWALTTVLMLLSAFKFGVVASVFMHLRYDNRILTTCFSGGLVVATGTILALLALFRDPTHFPVSTAEALSPSKIAMQPLSTTSVGNPEAGTLAFQKFGCGGCHTSTQIDGARGTVGPALDGLAKRAGTRVNGMSSQDYIRQSIDNPAGHLVPGYLNLMPALRSSMTTQEYRDIVALLSTL